MLAPGRRKTQAFEDPADLRANGKIKELMVAHGDAETATKGSGAVVGKHMPSPLMASLSFV